MDKSRYGDAARNPPPDWGSQDARNGTVTPASNFAIQPATNAGSVKLKKKTVKIVGRATPSTAPDSLTSGATTPITSRATTPAAAPVTVQTITPAPAPAAKLSPAPEPTKAKPDTSEGLEEGEIGDEVLAPITPPVHTDVAKADVASSLDELFARLSTRSARKSPDTMPARPDLSLFLFDDSTANGESGKPLRDMTNFADVTVALDKAGQSSSKPENTASERKLTFSFDDTTTTSKSAAKPSPKVKTPSEETKEPSKADYTAIEHEYLRKASEYVSALLTSNATPAHLIKAVSAKLSSSYVPAVKPDLQEVARLKARYVFAVTTYINQHVKMNSTPLTNDAVKGILQSTNGNFLALCATLVEQKYIALENLDHVAGLCKTILDALPTVDNAVELPSPLPHTGELRTSKDLMDGTVAWPTQEKRENAPTHRTVLLKNISNLSTSKLTPLIWGGRLESLSLPPSTPDIAVVKFLTPEACTRYLSETTNGIAHPLSRSNAPKFIFVEPQPGPSSINDVIRACIDSGTTRCVRATGTGDCWSEAALMKLALGSDKVKRDVERIKQGKTAKGARTVEFRFANIYHALSFRRQLVADEDWEHCNVQFVADPCDTATCVHLED